MAEPLRFVECPRDAWQGLPVVIPTSRKRSHLEKVLAAGFSNLDLGSFVAPRAVPQMADTEAVVEGLPRPPGADFLTIVANRRGLERAPWARSVSSVGYPLSVNNTFQRRNVGRSIDESWPLVAELVGQALEWRLGFVVYLSMGFGNPYGEAWRPADTARAVDRVRALGVTRIALADTVGTADAATVGRVLVAIDHPESLGLHLHARPGAWSHSVERALESGVRWFEGALVGIGGCPFAGDALVGNLPSEQLAPFLQRRGFDLGKGLHPLDDVAHDAAGIGRDYGATTGPTD